MRFTRIKILPQFQNWGDFWANWWVAERRQWPARGDLVHTIYNTNSSDSSPQLFIYTSMSAIRSMGFIHVERPKLQMLPREQFRTSFCTSFWQV
jgi:hypothetical protein